MAAAKVPAQEPITTSLTSEPPSFAISPFGPGFRRSLEPFNRITSQVDSSLFTMAFLMEG